MRPKTYLYSLFRSLTSIEYYLAVLRAPFLFSLRFFLISYLFFGLWVGFRVFSEFETVVAEQTEPTLVSIQEHFPEVGSILWNGDRIQVQPDPFFVRFPPYFAEVAELPEYFAVLTSDRVNPAELLERVGTTTWVVLSSDQVYSSNFRGEWTSAPISGVIDDSMLLVTKETLPQHLQTLENWINSLLPIAQVIVPLMSTGLLIVFRLWIVVMHALLTYLFLRINQVHIPLSKSIQLTLQLLVPLEVVQQVALVLYPSLNFSLMSIGFWILLLYLYLSQRKQLRELYAREVA
jgi:hypothetical protein